MKIINDTQKKILTTNFKIATSAKDQFLGLLDKKNPRALIFRTRWGIHSFGLKTKILVLILDSNYKVIISKVLKPWRIFIWNPRHNFVIELPISAKELVKPGDKILITKD